MLIWFLFVSSSQRVRYDRQVRSRLDCGLRGVPLPNLRDFSMHVAVRGLLQAWQPRGTWLQHVQKPGRRGLRLRRSLCHEGVRVRKCRSHLFYCQIAHFPFWLLASAASTPARRKARNPWTIFSPSIRTSCSSPRVWSPGFSSGSFSTSASTQCIHLWTYRLRKHWRGKLQYILQDICSFNLFISFSDMRLWLKTRMRSCGYFTTSPRWEQPCERSWPRPSLTWRWDTN